MKKGISLIVLIVTIVVLLILAVASTMLATGRFGIIDMTQKATNLYGLEAAKEKLAVKLEELKLRAFAEENTLIEYMREHKDEVDEILDDITYDDIDEDDEEIVFHVDDEEIIVDEDGEIMTPEEFEEKNQATLTIKYLNGDDSESSTFGSSEIEDEVYDVTIGDTVVIESRTISGYVIDFIRIVGKEIKEYSSPGDIQSRITVPIKNKETVISFIYVETEEDPNGGNSGGNNGGNSGGNNGATVVLLPGGSGASGGTVISGGGSGGSSGGGNGGSSSKPSTIIRAKNNNGEEKTVVSNDVTSEEEETYGEELGDTENENVYEDIEVVDAQEGQVLTIVYDVSKFADVNDKVRVYHRIHEGEWDYLGEYTVASNRTITFTVDSFSPFAFEVVKTPVVPIPSPVIEYGVNYGNMSVKTISKNNVNILEPTEEYSHRQLSISIPGSLYLHNSYPNFSGFYVQYQFDNSAIYTNFMAGTTSDHTGTKGTAYIPDEYLGAGLVRFKIRVVEVIRRNTTELYSVKGEWETYWLNIPAVPQVGVLSGDVLLSNDFWYTVRSTMPITITASHPMGVKGIYYKIGNNSKQYLAGSTVNVTIPNNCINNGTFSLDIAVLLNNDIQTDWINYYEPYNFTATPNLKAVSNGIEYSVVEQHLEESDISNQAISGTGYRYSNLFLVNGFGISTATITYDVSSFASGDEWLTVGQRQGTNGWSMINQVNIFNDMFTQEFSNLDQYHLFTFKKAAGYNVTVDVSEGNSDENTDDILLYFANGTTQTIHVSDGSQVYHNVVKIKPTGYLAIIENGQNKGLDYNTEYELTSNIDIYRSIAAECISYDTLVTMADGSLKKLGEIEVGDEVLSVDFETMKLVSRKVIASGRDDPKYANWYVDCYYKNVYSDGTVIDQAMRHRFYNLENLGFTHLHKWNIGEHAFSLTGENPTLVSRELIQGKLYYARITLEDCNCYFANGLLTGDSECPTGYSLTELLTR